MTIELELFILVGYLALYLSKKLKITRAVMQLWPFETANLIFLVTNTMAPVCLKWLPPSHLTINPSQQKFVVLHVFCFVSMKQRVVFFPQGCFFPPRFGDLVHTFQLRLRFCTPLTFFIVVV